MTENTPQIRWGVEKRLEFIEFRLFWEGKINRSDLMEKFGVSVPQASKDINHYKEIAPSNLDYDASEKRYLAASNFKPVFLVPEADYYLSQLKLITDKVTSPNDSWLSDVPSLDAMPIPHRRVDVSILRKVINTIRTNRSAEIFYQSMGKNAEPIWRWITPHAFGHDGFRWHVRAFCHRDSKFKDFLLSRFLDLKGTGEPGTKAEEDKYWADFLDVILVPNPAYSESQKKIIALEYGMENEKFMIPVRKAMLYYFKKRLRLDVADALDRPQEAPIVIENREEFETVLAEVSV